MPQLENKSVRAALKGLQDFGEAVFTLSQRGVPVDKGTLKKSGVLRLLPNGFEIAYRTPYAAPVHFGVPEHDERVQRHFVHPYQRKTARGGVLFGSPRRIRTRSVLVHGHYRGPFSRHMRDRAARPWLQDAFDELYPELGKYLKQRFVIEFGGR